MSIQKEKRERNPLLRRPIVNQNIVDFMRERQKPIPGKLGEIVDEGRSRDVPVIPHETAVFLDFYLGQTTPKQVLEIGTAIGFSSSLMAKAIGESGHVTTIERFDVMANHAKETYEKLGNQEKITLLEGEAAEILKTLEADTYDFVFMDSAKSKYIVFLPEILRVMKKNAVLMIDDIFQAGDILKPVTEVVRNQRAIHRGLNKFFDFVLPHPELKSTILPLGDGVILIEKQVDTVDLSTLQALDEKYRTAK
ncbi:MAG: O-methyltransferase [Streptococcaceae bacterium]|jgi:predicted O-methyltransferase YrrM|nr:O-methyltransferase [Streptococcaceae bacterium]